MAGALNITLTVLSILSILFAAVIYIISRLNNVEKRLEVECALRKTIEERMNNIEKKIDQILQYFVER